MRIKASNANTPNWRDITVNTTLPEALQPLDEIAHNMWWSWSHEAKELYKAMDEKLWHDVNQNPVLMLSRISYKKLEQLATNKDFLAQMKSVYKEFRTYMDVEPDKKRPSVAYLCMEYGLSLVVCNLLTIHREGLSEIAETIKETYCCHADI